MHVVPTYRRAASPLHAARASVSASYCAALAVVAFIYWPNPIVSAAVVLAVVAAGIGARVGATLRSATKAALWFALLVTVVNALVSTRGETVVFRAGTVLGHRFDITAEAIAWGAMTGLSLICVWLVFALYAAAVDPDEMLRMCARVSPRSALTAALATRLVPVLSRDARRHSEAARCRAQPAGRRLVARAAFAGALERAVEVAAALEVRGYALGRRRRGLRRPVSRHDIRIASTAAILVAVAVTLKVFGAGAVTADPTISVAWSTQELALVAVIIAAGLAPFAGRRAMLGVAHG